MARGFHPPRTSRQACLSSSSVMYLDPLVVGNADTIAPLSGANTLPAVAASDATILAGNLVV